MAEADEQPAQIAPTLHIAVYKEQLQNNKRLDKRHKRCEAVTVTGRRKFSKKRINHSSRHRWHRAKKQIGGRLLKEHDDDDNSDDDAETCQRNGDNLKTP